MTAKNTITAGSLVLVTGANGYIGLWTLKTLLDCGIRVRAAVRSEAKAQGLKDLFPDKVTNGQLEFTFLDDITRVSGTLSRL